MVDCTTLTSPECVLALIGAHPEFSAAVTIGLATLLSAIVAFLAATSSTRYSRFVAKREAQERGQALIEEAARRARNHYGICTAILGSIDLQNWSAAHRTLMMNRLTYAEQETLAFCRRAWAIADKASSTHLGLLAHHLIRLEGMVSFDATLGALLTDARHHHDIGIEMLGMQVDVTCDEIVRLAIEIEPALQHESFQRRRLLIATS